MSWSARGSRLQRSSRSSSRFREGVAQDRHRLVHDVSLVRGEVLQPAGDGLARCRNRLVETGLAWLRDRQLDPTTLVWVDDAQDQTLANEAVDQARRSG